MKDWEEILKERLEDYESSLPKGGLAQFREKVAANSGRKRLSPWWIAVPAAAACAAAALIVVKPGTKPIEEGTAYVAEAVAAPATEAVFDSETADLPETEHKVPSPSHMVWTASTVPKKYDSLQESKPYDTGLKGIEETEMPETAGNSAEPEERKTVADPVTEPAVEESTHSTPAQHKRQPGKHVGRRIVLPAIGGTLGTAISGLGTAVALAGPMAMADLEAPGVNYGSAPTDTHFGTDDHNMPLRLGLTARIPLGDRLSIVPGLEYSRYTSYFHYTISGTHTQKANYLGIPVRIDYSPVKTGRLDVYAGAGTSLDFCIGARNNGTRRSDGSPSLSLLTATGAEVRIAGPVALYLEPEIRWTALHGDLDTWRTAHPVSFSVGSGVRIQF